MNPKTAKNRAKRRRQMLKKPILKPVKVRSLKEWFTDQFIEADAMDVILKEI